MIGWLVAKYYVHYFSQNSYEILHEHERAVKMQECKINDREEAYYYYLGLKEFKNIDVAKAYLSTRLRQDRDMCDLGLKKIKTIKELK